VRACASTISWAGNVEEPNARILPWRCRSVSAERVSSTAVSGSGRCTWYRSIQSVSRRRRLLSTSRMIQRRELPRLFGSPPGWPITASMAKWTFVARTTSSRRPFASALPTTSDSPCEYTSAVSMKLTPAGDGGEKCVGVVTCLGAVAARPGDADQNSAQGAALCLSVQAMPEAESGS
jgi:hypothetical protein